MRVPYFGKPPYAQVSKIEASDEANWQDSPKRVDQVPGADADWQHRWRRDSTAFRRHCRSWSATARSGRRWNPHGAVETGLTMPPKFCVVSKCLWEIYEDENPDWD